MRTRIYLTLCISVLVISSHVQAQRLCIKFSTKIEASRFSRDNRLAKPFFAERTSISIAMAQEAQRDAEAELMKWVVLTNTPNTNLDSLIAKLRTQYVIDEAAPAKSYKLDKVETLDSLISTQWSLDALRAQKVWKQSTGKNVVVAIIDTGIDWQHEDLQTQLWTNRAEDLNGNGQFEPWPSTERRNDLSGDLDGIDNDGNGFIDDVIGYNFVDQALQNLGDWKGRDAFPFDEVGHGTQVAGVIAAAHDNRHGISGLAYDAKLMSLRAFDVSGNAEEDDIAASVIYATLNGARVINCSFGDVSQSTLVRDAMQYAFHSGVTLVASSGNGGGPGIHFPSDFSSVISVGATTIQNRRALFSSYNTQLSVVAPGQAIVTTSPLNAYSTVSGTSFSAPTVAAAVALVLEKNSNLGPSEIRQTLERTANGIDSLNWSTQTASGLIDIESALTSVGSGRSSIDEPSIDASFTRDITQSIVVKGYVSDPLLADWSLQLAEGFEPSSWKILHSSSESIASSSALTSIDLNTLRDTSFTLRLVLQLRNGKQVIRATRFRILPSRLRILSATSYPIWNGDQRQLAVEVLTDRIATVRARLTNSSRTITANSIHYGTRHFLMVALESMNGSGVLRVEAVTSLGDSIAREFSVDLLSQSFQDTCFVKKSFRAPRLFLNSQSAISSQKRFVATDISKEQRTLGSYQLIDNKIIKVDSLSQPLFARGIGNTNADGTSECWLYSGGQSLLVELTSEGKFGRTLFADTSSRTFWATRLFDVSGDGSMDLLGYRTGRFYADSVGRTSQHSDAIELWSWRNSKYSFTGQSEIASRPPSDKSVNLFSSPGGAVGDFDKDGRIEIGFTDSDGDFQIAEWDGSRFRNEFILENGKDSDAGTEFTTEVDIDGDGAPEILHGYPSSTRSDEGGESEPTAWTFKLFKSDTPNTYRQIWGDSFFGVRYGKPYYNGVASGSLDSRKGDEFVLSIFPYLYVFGINSDMKTIEPRWFKSGVWSNSALIADLDGNGRNEIAFVDADSNETQWWEYNVPAQRLQPPSGIVLRRLKADSLTLRWNNIEGAAAYRVKQEYIEAGATTGLVQFNVVTTNALQFSSRDTSGTLLVEIVSLIDQSDTSTTASSKQRRFELSPDIELRSCSVVQDDEHYIIAGFTRSVSSLGVSPTSFHILSMDGHDFKVLSTNFVNDSIVMVRVAGPPLPAGTYTVSIDSSLATMQYPPLRGKVALEIKSDEILASLSFSGIRSYDERSLTAIFSDSVDASALNLSNYSSTQGVKIIDAAYTDAAQKLVRFTFDASQTLGARGIVYSLTASPNVKSVRGRRMTTGAGNTLSWVYQPSSIDESFAFPQPFKLSEQEFLHFAGVPTNATVVVMTIDGIELAQIRERDGDGGVRWNVRSEGGGLMSSGVYLFKIVQSDGTESVNRKFILQQ